MHFRNAFYALRRKIKLDEYEESLIPKIPYIVLPEHILYNRNIQPLAKELYCVINYLNKGKNGCFASNEYLGRIVQIEERTVLKHLATLEWWGYIIVKNKRKKNRKIFINIDPHKFYMDAAYKVYMLKDSNRDIKKDCEYGKQLFLDSREKYFGGK